MNTAKYKYNALNQCHDELVTMQRLGIGQDDAGVIIASIFAKGEKSGLTTGQEIAINHIKESE